MARKDLNPFGARARFATEGGEVEIHRLAALEREGGVTVSDLPFSIKVILEAVLRNLDGEAITEEHVRSLSRWGHAEGATAEVPFTPARVLMQDFTGVPAVVDLAAGEKIGLGQAAGDFIQLMLNVFSCAGRQFHVFSGNLDIHP